MHIRLLFALAMALLLSPHALAQPPSAVPDEAAAPTGDASGTFLVIPPGGLGAELPPDWSIAEARADEIVFASPTARLALRATPDGAPAERRAALDARLRPSIEGDPTPITLLVAGTFVEGAYGRVPGGNEYLLWAERGCEIARGQDGCHGITVELRGRRKGREMGDALALVEKLRLRGERAPEPFPALDLESVKEARINPVGLIIPLAKGYKPILDKGRGLFTLRGPAGTVTLRRAPAATLRELMTRDEVIALHPSATVTPLFWRAPGHHRAWRVVEQKGDAVTKLRDIHLVRFRKLDDWLYYRIDVVAAKPERGVLPLRSIVARVKQIP